MARRKALKRRYATPDNANASPARRFLRNEPCHFLLLLDDAEAARRPFLHEVFRRYRVCPSILEASFRKTRGGLASAAKRKGRPPMI